MLKLLFLKHNLRAPSQGLDSSSPPEEFVVPNSIMCGKDDKEEEQDHQVSAFSKHTQLLRECDCDTDINRQNSREEDEHFK